MSIDNFGNLCRFFQDMFAILFASCARLLPHRRGYNQLPTSSRGRGSREEENGKYLILPVWEISLTRI